MKASPPEIEALLRVLDEAYDHRSWHGTNLRGSLRGLKAKLAAWRPAAGRHNIWELVLHAAYWKYVVRRRLRGEKRGSFPLKGSNFFARPARAAEEAAWRADVALLDEEHRQLRSAAAALPPGRLKQRITPGWKCFDAIIGIAFHDIYHAGQIQLLKRLQKPRAR